MKKEFNEDAVKTQLVKSATDFFVLRNQIKKTYGYAKTKNLGQGVLSQLRQVEQKLQNLQMSLDSLACDALPDYPNAFKIFMEVVSEAPKRKPTIRGGKDMLDKKTAAFLLGVGVRGIEGLMKRRALPFHRISSRCVRFARADIEAFLANVAVTYEVTYTPKKGVSHG